MWGTFWDWAWRHRRYLLAALVLAVGVGFAVFTGLRAAQTEDPASGGELGLYLLITSALQVAGGIILGRVGRVEATHARSAVRRLGSVGQTVSALQVHVDEAHNAGDAPSVRRALIHVETGLESMSGHLYDAVRDWQDVHPEAVRDVVAEAEVDE